MHQQGHVDLPPLAREVSDAWAARLPGTLGLIGITELFGDEAEAGSENFASALIATGSVGLGVLVGVMGMRAARAARHAPVVGRILG
jgi:hypothetical protein